MVQPGCEHRPIELYLRTNSDIKNDKINSISIVQRVLGVFLTEKKHAGYYFLQIQIHYLFLM